MSVDAHPCLRVVEAAQHAELVPVRHGDVTFPSPSAPGFRLTCTTGPTRVTHLVGTASKRRAASLRVHVSAT